MDGILAFAREIVTEGDLAKSAATRFERDAALGRLIVLLREHDRVVELARTALSPTASGGGES